MVKPWLDAGYECWIVDIQHPMGITKDGNLIRVGADVMEWLPPLADYKIVFSFPMCTDLATSGALHFRNKGIKRLVKSLALVDRCREIGEWSKAPWMLENPVSVISSYWRKPDFTFHPYEFAGYLDDPNPEAYTKKTCLWTGNGFRFPETKPIEVVKKNFIRDIPPSKERQNIRSATPIGFAKAIFEANHSAQSSLVN